MAKQYTGGANPALEQQCDLIDAQRALRSEMEKPFPNVERVNNAEGRVRLAEMRLQAISDGRVERR